MAEFRLGAGWARVGRGLGETLALVLFWVVIGADGLGAVQRQLSFRGVFEVFFEHGLNGLAGLSACNAQANTDDTEEYEVSSVSANPFNPWLSKHLKISVAAALRQMEMYRRGEAAEGKLSKFCVLRAIARKTGRLGGLRYDCDFSGKF